MFSWLLGRFIDQGVIVSDPSIYIYTYRDSKRLKIFVPLRENQVFPDGAKYFWVAPCFKNGHLFLFWQF